MEKVTLKVQYGNFSVEVSGEEKYAEEKLDELLKKYGNITKAQLPNQVKEDESKPTKPHSPAEFIKKIAPKGQPDRALILGYYIEKYQNKENFSTNDLTELNRQAKQVSFTNISDTVAKQVQQGLMMGSGQDEGKRLFTLTTTGEETVENLINQKNKNNE